MDAEELIDPAKRRRSVLFYLIDTCRADHLSVYGNENKTSPFLDSIAERSVVFERCYSQAAWTKPSIAALLTSKYSSEVGVYSLTQLLPEVHLTFPEVLESVGYATAGFSANPIVGRFSNYQQGFGHFFESRQMDGTAGPSGSAAKLNEEVVRWLGEEQTWPQFLYVHSVDPHAAYEPAAEFLEQFADPARDPDYRKDWKALMATLPRGVKGKHFDQWNFDRAGVAVEPFIEHGLGLYDADILANDVAIEELWGQLAAQGWGEDLILIVTSDHGEEFFDHGATSHGFCLYEEMVNVPLLIHAPGLLPEGLRIDRPVRSIDIYPTLLSLLGIDVPEGLRGRSLVPLIRGAEAWKDEPVFSEVTEDKKARMAGAGNGSLMSMIEGDWKLIVNFRAPTHAVRPRHELYDLDADPGELDNLAEQHPERVARMEQELLAWFANNVGLYRAGEAVAEGVIDPERLAQLQQLGYVGDDDVELADIGERLPSAVQAVLTAADSWWLMALHPRALEEEAPLAPEARSFHGHEVLGAALTEGEEQTLLLAELWRGIAASEGPPADCFSPRHGIRASYRGHEVELLISFECSQVQVYFDGGLLASAAIEPAIEPSISALFVASGLSLHDE